MPKAVSAMPHDCPRCGAPLPPSKDGRTVCKYCRNTVNLDLPRQPHPAKHSPRVFSWLRAELWWTALVVLAVGVWQAQRLLAEADSNPTPAPPSPEPTASAVAPSPAPTAPAPAAERIQRIEGKLLLSDSAQDKHQDCLAVGRFSGSDVRWLVAISGKDGRVLWRHSLQSTADKEFELGFSAASVIVKTSERLVRLNAADGQLVWQTESSAREGRLCATSAYVAIAGASAPAEAWDWKTGRTLRVKPGDCAPLYSTKDAGSNFQYLESTAMNSIIGPTKGFVAVRGLIPHQGNARVVLGERTPSTAKRTTPQVGVVAYRRWVWTKELSEYMDAVLPTPAIAAVRRESVVVPYWDPENKVLRLGAFALERGGRMWDVAIAESPALSAKTDLDVAITLDGTVLVRMDGQLSAFALDNGASLWNIGGGA